MKKWVKNQLHQLWMYHTQDNRNVFAEHKFVSGIFYIVSEAGVLVYKPKKEHLISKFRNDIINRFEAIMENEGPSKTKDIYRLYAEARKDYKVTWRANARTRLRSLINNAI